MVEMNLKIDLSKVEDRSTDKTLKDLSDTDILLGALNSLIINYAQSGGRRGFDFKKQRCYDKMIDAIELAIEKKEDKVILEDSWFDILYEAMEKGEMMPNKVVNRVFDLIEEAKSNSLKNSTSGK